MGMNALLSADWHLVDSVLDEYRWKVFDNIKEISLEQRINQIFILGDFIDRKDRHAAEFLNRVVISMKDLVDETGAPVTILMGNHDMPLKGTPYWSFLNQVGVRYVTEPTLIAGVWCLPFSANPLEDWRGLPFAGSRAILMHQTVAGSLLEGDRKIEKEPNPLPIFPRGVPVYSGDIHRPQTTSGVTYVGVPHPTRFGETWSNRVLLIKNGDFKAPIVAGMRTIKRAILDISSVEELQTLRYRPGDQVRVRFQLTPTDLMSWSFKEEVIRAWASTHGIVVVSIEAVLIKELAPQQNAQKGEEYALLNPVEVIRSFSEQEGLGEDVLQYGLTLLKGAQSCSK